MINKFNYWYFKDAIPSHICDQIVETGIQGDLDVALTGKFNDKKPEEIDKKDYYFISKKMFDFLKKRNFFIEYAKVFNNYYGTSLEKTKKINNSGKDILFDIDWQGSRKIKKKLGDKVTSIFILQPSKKELIRRLNKRAQDPKNVVKERLSSFTKELSHWKEYKYVLVNDTLEKAAKRIMNIINLERKFITNSEHLTDSKNAKLDQLIKRLKK